MGIRTFGQDLSLCNEGELGAAYASAALVQGKVGIDELRVAGVRRMAP